MTLMLLMLKYLDNMKKTKEIQKSLRIRRDIQLDINELKYRIDVLNNRLKTFESKKKILDFELLEWDKFNNKTNF